MKKEEIAKTSLRLGLAFVFLYAGIKIFVDPSSWIGFVPNIFGDPFLRQIMLYLHGGFDILLGVWLLTNREVYYASILCSLNVLGIITLNITAMDIIFRDIAVLAASLALAALNYEGKEVAGKKAEAKNKKS